MVDHQIDQCFLYLLDDYINLSIYISHICFDLSLLLLRTEGISRTVINHCSTDITLSFNTLLRPFIHPNCELPLNPTPHIRSNYSFHQSTLLHSLHISKPPQHTAQPANSLTTPVLLHREEICERQV